MNSGTNEHRHDELPVAAVAEEEEDDPLLEEAPETALALASATLGSTLDLATTLLICLKT